MGHGHPQEHGPGEGQGQVWAQHSRGWGAGTDLHLAALGVMSSPLCILPAVLERCALVPAPSPHQGGRRQGHRKLVLGQNLRVGGRGRCPQAHSIQELPDTPVLNSLPQVRERDLPFVTHTLSSEFTILRVVNGETVAAENLGITNGFVKPKMGESEGRRVGAG